MRLDRDPYVVVSEGRLYWIVDAYTTSNRFPYAEPLRLSRRRGDQINYIRNPVKVVVDAYHGTVDFYTIDPEEPILKAWNQVFPGMFKPVSQAPEDLTKHFRYPVDLFRIQAHLYRTYHMSDPEVYYNREDQWRVPNEVYEGNEQSMLPYYVIMRLPGEERDEFLLILPFTPENKDNMVAWLAARSDVPYYGQLRLFEFPKKELVYGPMQIEARIDQSPEISEVLTLWSQKGSNVIRGNLLVIPIAGSILYVEPIFLEAESGGAAPSLERVVVATADRVTGP